MAFQITQTVHCIPVGQGPSNVYLIVGQNALFVDTGYSTDESFNLIVDTWKRLGEPIVAAIALTHRHSDHIGGALRLARLTGGPIFSTGNEKPYIEKLLHDEQYINTVSDGHVIDLGDVTLEFIHSPGHTTGSLCILLREESILFTGDTILGSSSTSINPLQGDMALLLETLRKLLTYKPNIIAPGHGPIITDPENNIRILIERRLKRENELIEMLRKKPATIEDLRNQLYSKLPPSLYKTSYNQVASHLIKLVKDGKVSISHSQTGDMYLLS